MTLGFSNSRLSQQRALLIARVAKQRSRRKRIVNEEEEEEEVARKDTKTKTKGRMSKTEKAGEEVVRKEGFKGKKSKLKEEQDEPLTKGKSKSKAVKPAIEEYEEGENLPVVQTKSLAESKASKSKGGKAEEKFVQNPEAKTTKSTSAKSKKQGSIHQSVHADRFARSCSR